MNKPFIHGKGRKITACQYLSAAMGASLTESDDVQVEQDRNSATASWQKWACGYVAPAVNGTGKARKIGKRHAKRGRYPRDGPQAAMPPAMVAVHHFRPIHSATINAFKQSIEHISVSVPVHHADGSVVSPKYHGYAYAIVSARQRAVSSGVLAGNKTNLRPQRKHQPPFVMRAATSREGEVHATPHHLLDAQRSSTRV